jgi:ABC-type glycerol-3-phosphate transport system substrate-binding protein
MNKIKFSLLFLFYVILIFGLIGCAKDKVSKEVDEKPINHNERMNNEDSDNEATKEERYPAIDLGGRVIRIANHWDMTPLGGTELRDKIVERHAFIEEKYNITIEYVEVTFDEKINTLTSSILANDPFADLVSLGSGDVTALYNEEYLIPFNEIVDMDHIAIPDNIVELGMFGDNLLMISHQMNQSGGIFYNKDLFAQAGLPDPYELQEKGEWTWDAFLEAAKELTAGDQYGLSGDPNVFANYFIASNDQNILNTDNLEVTIDSPKVLESLEFMAALYNEHRVIKPNEGDNWENPRQYFTEGLVGMTQGWTWEMEGRADVAFDWGYVFWPKGPQADDYYVPVDNFEGLTIPVGVKDPEIVYQIWEDLQSWDIVDDERNEWFELISPNVETYETILEMQDHIRPNYWPAYGIGEAFYEMNANIAEGTESPSQAVAKVKGEAQALVDEFMK